MNKEEFLAELREKLSGLPQNEREERIAFYSEMIADRVDDGASEEEAVAGIGSVDSVVEQIMSEVPMTMIVRERVSRKRKLRGWEIILLILGSPVWIPLLAAGAAVLLALFAAVWAVVLSLWAADLGLFAGAGGCLIGIFPYLRAGSPEGALFSAGAGLICAGLAILLFFGCAAAARGAAAMMRKTLTGLKVRFVGKEA